jgi:iron complex outermembrane receptor protein
MHWVEYFISTQKNFADANTFKTNFSQKFSNTFSNSLGLKTSTDNWKFLARGNQYTHSDYRISEIVTNTRYNETDFKTAITVIPSFLCTAIQL